MPHQNKQKIIFLSGPTAIGKTEMALRLAEALPLEIISVDSALIYRHMDIGTAKPEPEQLRAVPHHLIDIKNPDESYSAAAFCNDAQRIIGEIVARQRYPLLVGGTMLYFQALQQGLADLPAANQEIRQAISHEAEQYGWDYCHRKLVQVDAIAGQRILPTDSQRIQRALEVFYLSGEPLSTLLARSKKSCPYDILSVAIVPAERLQLHQRINQRFIAMIDNGLIDEAKSLQQKFQLHADLPAMRTVGYRQVWQYLAEEIDYPALLASGQAATRQLAKRQITWLTNTLHAQLYDQRFDDDPALPKLLLDKMLEFIR